MATTVSYHNSEVIIFLYQRHPKRDPSPSQGQSTFSLAKTENWIPNEENPNHHFSYQEISQRKRKAIYIHGWTFKKRKTAEFPAFQLSFWGEKRGIGAIKKVHRKGVDQGGRETQPQLEQNDLKYLLI